MKFSTDRESLLRPLQLVTGVVERRQTLPVLANILVVANEQGLQITGTDLEVELQVSVPGVDVSAAGEVTLPARKLADIWRSLPENATVSVELQADRAIVRSGRSRFTLATLPASDFPKVEPGEGDVTLSISEDNLQNLIDRVGFAMAQQDVRFFLNGMLLEIADDHVRTVATDGHRLAMSTLAQANEGVSSRVSAIVPRKGVLELARLIEGGSEPVGLTLGKNQLTVSCRGYVLTTKLVDGQFPNYENVIPREIGKTLEGDREAFRQAFLRASILSNEKYRGVRLLMDEGQLTIQANNPDQEEAEEVVAIDYPGPQHEIGFNVTYLQDVLNVLKTESVRFSLAEVNSSALIEGVGEEDSVYVVMPMRL